MPSFDDSSKQHMLTQQHNGRDSQDTHFDHVFDYATERPSRRVNSWPSVAVILLLLYIALIETINITASWGQQRCGQVEREQLSKYCTTDAISLPESNNCF